VEVIKKGKNDGSTVGDSWLDAILESSSTLVCRDPGCRYTVGKTLVHRTLNVAKGSPLANTLLKVEEGTRKDEMWVSKVEPGGLTLTICCAEK
jgi:hypothetical protein